MEIYIMNGQGGTGKDTFQSMVRDAILDKKVAKVSMVDYTKQFASTYLDWDGEKTPKARKMLCNLKDILDDWMDASFKDVKSSIELLRENGTDIVFIDAREPRDIARLVSQFDAMTILIVRNGKDEYGNHADDGVFDYTYDITINNDGTLEDLKKEAEGFAETHEMLWDVHHNKERRN